MNMEQGSKDLINHKFGKLIVINKAKHENNNKNSYWNCICDCGNNIIVSRCNLIQNHTKSCGCIKELPEKEYLDYQKKRFFKFVNKTSDCWIWIGSKDKGGYGCFNYRQKKVKAHRYSYEIHKGKINNLLVCHSCDNPSCVKPDHLFLGTYKENMNDLIKKGGYNKHKDRYTDLQIEAIICLHKEGFKIREICELLDLSQGGIKTYVK